MAGQGGFTENQPALPQLPINPELQKLIQSRFNQAYKLNPAIPMIQNRVAEVMRMPAQYGALTPQTPPVPVSPPVAPQGAIDPTQLLGRGQSLQRRIMGAAPPVPPNGQQLSPLLAMLYRRFGGV